MNAPVDQHLSNAASPRPLPPGWRWVRLGDVCEVQNGFAFDSARFSGTEGIPLIRIRDLKTNLPSEKYSGDFDREYLVEPGDLLVGMDGEFGCYRWDGPTALLNQRVCRLLPRPSELTAEFLRLALNDYLKEIERETSFTTVKHISSRQILGVRFALPSVKEQKRIAAALAEQMAAVERARAAAEAQLEAATALPAAYRRTAFTSAEAQRWPRVRLGDFLLEPLRTGISKPARPGADKECLTLSAIRGGFLELSARKAVGVTDDEANGAWVRAGAFYVVRGNGRLSLVGRGALAPPVMSTPVLYPDLLIQVIPDSRVITLGYLRHVWESEEVRADVERRARTSAGIFKINQANLADVRVPLPDRGEQELVTSRLDRQLVKSGQVRKIADEQLAAVNNAPAALLRRAFSGEL